MLATEEEAMAWRSWGFSFSRLKGLDFTLLPFLSSFCFGGLEIEKFKLDNDERPEDVEANDGLIGWRADVVVGSDSPFPKGSSVAPCSFSWRTFDASRRAGFFH